MRTAWDVIYTGEKYDEMKSPDGRRVGWLIWTRSRTRTTGDGVALVEEEMSTGVGD